jgi:hypothetical protein
VSWRSSDPPANLGPETVLKAFLAKLHGRRNRPRDLQGKPVTIAHLDPLAHERRVRKPVPPWAVALGVLAYSGLAWALILTAGAGLWDWFVPTDVFAASHRG